MAKIVILGLDGFNPEFVKQWSDKVPNLMEMQKEGIWGSLESMVPPTTPQVWTCTQVGRNPGFYGFWDFTYRDDFSYGEPKSVNSKVVQTRVNPLYKALPRLGQKVAIINVPVTYPPPKIPAGYCISGSIPSLDQNFTYPDNLKDEVYKLVGDYIIDVSILEKENKDAALKRIYEMDTQRFTLLKHFIRKKKCDYIFTATTGLEKISCLFHHYFDEEHVHYEPNSSYANTLKDYYKFVDKNIGEIRTALGNDTVLFILSSYSAQRLDGRININEWLVQNKYMKLSEYPSEPTPLKNLSVEWSRTKAWAIGCTGQIYLNLKGREVQGVVDPKDYDRVLDELAIKIKEIPGKDGQKLNTQVFEREDIYFGPFTKYGPDLFISFDNYHWNVSELVGHGKGNLYSHGPDVGHGVYGYFCIAGARIPARGEIKGFSILNVTPTVLDIMRLPISKNMEKPSMLTIAKKRGTAYSEEATKTVHSRLEALGY